MYQAAQRRRRPWTVVVAVITTVVHLLLLAFGLLVASSLLGGLPVFLAAMPLMGAAFWTLVSSLRVQAGAAKTHRSGLISTATLLGLELLCLGVLWLTTLSGDCPPEGCVPSNEEWALVELVLFSPLFLLGTATLLLLRTPSATSSFHRP